MEKNTVKKQQPEQGHAQHAEEHRGAERLAHLCTGAGCEHQRHGAQDEGEGCHQDRAQPRARGLHGGVPAVGALLLGLLGELGDQDRILSGESDQHHEADLVRMLLSIPRSSTPLIAANRHMGTIRITASGSSKLSYCAAKSRNTNATARLNAIVAVLPPTFSCSAISVHSKPKPAGRLAARRPSF
jgi:hypothetical protein